MTLALHGKTRTRQASLVLGAIFALLAALTAGIAAREASTASAFEDLYQVQTFSVEDYAEPEGVLRAGELAPIENAQPVDVALIICMDHVDATNVDLPAPFTYRVNGEPLGLVFDSNGGHEGCFPIFHTLDDLTQPLLVEQIIPMSWENAPGYPLRRVIHYQDNPQANRPGSSTLVQFATGKGGDELICYEPGIEGFAPQALLPGTGLACHVVFENVRAEPVTTPTPTATATQPQAPTQPTQPATSTPTPSPSPTPVGGNSVTPMNTASATATGTSTVEPGAGGRADQPNTGEATATSEVPSTGGGGDGSASTVQPEETVAGERTPAVGSTPVAPDTGEGGEIAGRHPAVWAVAACFLFALSMSFTLIGMWRRER